MSFYFFKKIGICYILNDILKRNNVTMNQNMLVLLLNILRYL